MRRALPLLLLAAVALLVGCAAPTPAPASRSALEPVTLAPDPGGTPPRALDALGLLPVKGRGPKTGYSRDQFGPAWADTDHNGCDQRNDVLARDMHDETLQGGRCVVLSGILDDPYTGKVIEFKRGPKTSTAVQIDHVVSLSDAWQKGAAQLTPDRREALATDPANLQAVDGPTNEAKGDGDAATWLPPRVPYRCLYVARQIGVKIKYGLSVTQAEHDAMATVLATCPDQKITEPSAA